MLSRTSVTPSESASTHGDAIEGSVDHQVGRGDPWVVQACEPTVPLGSSEIDSDDYDNEAIHDDHGVAETSRREPLSARASWSPLEQLAFPPAVGTAGAPNGTVVTATPATRAPLSRASSVGNDYDDHGSAKISPQATPPAALASSSSPKVFVSEEAVETTVTTAPAAPTSRRHSFSSEFSITSAAGACRNAVEHRTDSDAGTPFAAQACEATSLRSSVVYNDHHDEPAARDISLAVPPSEITDISEDDDADGRNDDGASSEVQVGSWDEDEASDDAAANDDGIVDISDDEVK